MNFDTLVGFAYLRFTPKPVQSKSFLTRTGYKTWLVALFMLHVLLKPVQLLVLSLATTASLSASLLASALLDTLTLWDALRK